MTQIEKIKFAWNRICYGSEITNKKVFNNETHTDGFTGTINDTFIIRFNGTDFIDWKDIKTDFWFCKKKVPYDNYDSSIRVHTGLIDAYKSIRLELHQRYKNSEKNKIFISGHSLGGALTTLAAVDFQYNFKPELEAVAFASLRIGNPSFVKSFNKRVPQFLNVINGQDLVTKLPPFWTFYQHVKEKVFIGKRKWYLLLGSVKDHYWEKYHNNILTI